VIACRQFSRAYLHHVVKSGEIIACMLVTWHSLVHYQRLMADLRRAIAEGTLAEVAASTAANNDPEL
jgi:queuine tRNA-ribosyltransferase